MGLGSCFLPVIPFAWSHCQSSNSATCPQGVPAPGSVSSSDTQNPTSTCSVRLVVVAESGKLRDGLTDGGIAFAALFMHGSWQLVATGAPGTWESRTVCCLASGLTQTCREGGVGAAV